MCLPHQVPQPLQQPAAPPWQQPTGLELLLPPQEQPLYHRQLRLNLLAQEIKLAPRPPQHVAPTNHAVTAFAAANGVIVAPRRLTVAHVVRMEAVGMILPLHRLLLLPPPLLPPASPRTNRCHHTLPITGKTVASSLTLETGNHVPQTSKSMPTLIW
jgi:hypothetical protein